MSEKPSPSSNDNQALLERFDAAWYRGDVPEIDDLLSSRRTDSQQESERVDQLVELIMLDLEYRWRHAQSERLAGTQAASPHGTPPRQSLPSPPLLEDYFDRYPELVARCHTPLDLIAEEYRARHRWGDRPGHDAYDERFPAGGDALRAALQAVDEALPAQGRPSGLRVHCPHCQNSVEITVDDQFEDIRCSSCGSSFGVLQDDTLASAAGHPQKIGHFELVARLGQGSFGTVWQARDTDLDRMVALKIPRGRQLEPIEVEHFLREARAVAQLRHPNIVSVHEVGRDGETVYIVSDLVQGTLLSDWCAEQRPTTTEAVELCRKIAETLHHAHLRGVVHRDLKPQNIVIDVGGEPQLMDFGLARREAGEVTMTMEGQLLGTPAYMSPEQAVGKAHQADRRSDIYSLGVILFELLTGELPFRGNVRMLIQQVVHEEAPSPRKFNASVPRDLEIICLKCLEKDADNRYGSAQDVADELGRFLDGRPIHARPISGLARGWRRCKRNPLVASLVAALSLALLSGLIGVTSQWIRAENNAAREATARRETRRNLYVADMNVAQEAWEANDIARVLELLARYRPTEGAEDLRGFQWYYLWQLCQRGVRAPTFSYAAPVSAIALSRDGTTLAAAGFDNTVKLWNVATGQAKHTIHTSAKYSPFLAFSPDGKTLVAADGDWGEKARLWDADTGEELFTIHPHATVFATAFSPDGNRLAVTSLFMPVVLENLAPNRERMTLGKHGPVAYAVAFSPDGKLLATGSQSNTIKLWDLATAQEVATLTGHTNWVHSVAFAPDGKMLASAGFDNSIRLWDVEETKLIADLKGHAGQVWAVTFSPDGTLASASADNTVKLWDAETLREKDTLKGHGKTVSALAFSADGKWLASGSLDGNVKLWNMLDTNHPDILRGHAAPIRSVAVTPDGRTVISGSDDHTARVWDLRTGRHLQTLEGHTDWVNAVAVSPDCETLATVGQDNHLMLWELATGQLRVDFPRSVGRGTRAVAFSPDGKVLATGDDHFWASVWNSDPLSRISDGAYGIIRHGFWVNAVTFSPDGRTVASGGHDNIVKLWDAQTQEVWAELEGHRGFVLSLAYSPDGKTLASGSFDNTVILWDVETSTVREQLTEHAGAVGAVAFSPDGRILATGSSDNTIKLWYLGTRKAPETLIGHKSDVSAVAFSPDGNTLTSGSYDATVRIWRRATEEEVQAAANDGRMAPRNDATNQLRVSF